MIRSITMITCVIRWMSRSAMRPAEGDTSDCILVVGISRPKMAAAFLTVVLLSLFLTFHILYDSAVYSLHAASAVEGRTVELVSQVRATPPLLFSSKVHFPRTSRHLPQAIIIGVRKCGTRALLEMLFLHPQIQKAAGEVHFFDRDDNYGKGLEWYRRKMPYSFRGQITIEKSPSYFVTPEVSANSSRDREFLYIFVLFRVRGWKKRDPNRNLSYLLNIVMNIPNILSISAYRTPRTCFLRNLSNFSYCIGLATKWSRILLLSLNDKIRNHLVAIPINPQSDRATHDPESYGSSRVNHLRSISNWKKQ